MNWRLKILTGLAFFVLMVKLAPAQDRADGSRSEADDPAAELFPELAPLPSENDPAVDTSLASPKQQNISSGLKPENGGAIAPEALSALSSSGADDGQPDETLPGFTSGNVFHAKGVDNVNVFSGDPGIVIPFPSYVLSPGYSWGLTAYNTSKFWHFDTSTACLDAGGAKARHANIHGYPTLGAGWTLDPGYIGNSIGGASFYHRPDGGTPRGLEAARLRITSGSTNANCSASPCTTVEFPDGSTQIFDHAYTRAHPTNTTSHDFTDENKWLDNTTRYGLSKIVDRFGHVVLRVNYDPTFPDEFTSFVLYADQSVTINVTWQTLPAIADANNGNPAWRTIQKIDFPATGTQTLSVFFTYDTSHGGIARNSYDTSAGLTCANPATTAVPYLTKIDFKNQSGTILSTYQSAPCFDLISCTNSDYFGSIAKLTLPTAGALSYHYGPTNDSCVGTLTDCTDPELGVRQPGLAPVQGAAAPQTALDFERFEDASAAVYQRDELDSAGSVLSTVKYNRYDYIPWNSALPTSPPLTTKIARQVVVKENSGDGNFYKTKHLFHGAYFASGSQPDDGGREIERRYYDKGAEANTTVIRTIINCLTTGATDGTGICGYRSSATSLTDMGLINAYGLFGEVREQRSVTWYGANPTANNGGTCSGTSPACTSSASTGSWDDTAKSYKTTTISSTLTGMTGWTSRASTTTWNAQTGTHWLLDIFSAKSATDSGTGLPAPASVQTNYTFDTTNGYLQSSSTSDATYGGITRSFSATPDSFGNPTTRVLTGSGLPSGSFTDTWSFAKNGLLTAQRTGIGWKSFDVTRDSRTGSINASRDPNATLSTSYVYDALGRLTTITPPGGELATAISYDSPTQTTVTRGSGSAGTRQRFLYDSLGRIQREIKQLASTSFSVKLHKYDSADHENFVSEWTSCGTAAACGTASPASGTTSSNFDPFSRPRQITRADNTTTSISYVDGTITHSDSLESVTVNNVGGAASTTVTRKDALGRVITVTEPSVGGVADVTSYTYNVLDKLSGVTQGVQSRSFTYDSFGFLRSETNPEKGTTSYGPYDVLGDVLGKTDGGISYTNTYDAAGRLWTEYAGGVEYAANCYDGTTYVAGVSSGCPEGKAVFAGGTYHLGKLTRRYGYNPSITANASTDDFTYSDTTGRLSSETTTANTGTALAVTQSWTYNTLGLIATHNYPRSSGTFPVTYTYSFGLPTTIVANGSTVASSVGYNPAGALQAWTDGGAVTTTIAANVIPSRPTSISTSNGAFSTGTYSYDGAGNITAIGSDSFKYDGRSRLVSEVYSGQPTPCTDSLGNLSRGQCFSYDRYGNLTGVTGDNARTLATSTTNNHLSSGTYDTRGNLTIFGAETLTWDAINRQIREQSSGVDWKYLYDGGNERIGRIPASGTTFYTFRDEGSRVATEYAGTAVGRDNVFLGNLMVASFVSNSLSGTPGWTYFHSDHLGTPRYLTGAETGSPKYWPYGDEVTANTTTQKLRFATMERDLEANHYYDHARSHDFNLGRFLGVDKAVGRTLHPMTWNRYTYALDNPVKLVDPNGLDPQPYTMEGLKETYHTIVNGISRMVGNYFAAHPAVVSVGGNVSAVAFTGGGSLDLRVVADTRGTVGLRASVAGRVGGGALVSANVVAGISTNSVLKTGGETSTQKTIEGDVLYGGGVTASSGEDGKLSFSTDATLKGGVGLGAAATTDYTGTFTLPVVNLFGNSVQPAAQGPPKPPGCPGDQTCVSAALPVPPPV